MITTLLGIVGAAVLFALFATHRPGGCAGEGGGGGCGACDGTGCALKSGNDHV